MWRLFRRHSTINSVGWVVAMYLMWRWWLLYPKDSSPSHLHLLLWPSSALYLFIWIVSSLSPTRYPLWDLLRWDVLLGFFDLSGLQSISNGLGLILCQIRPNHSLNLLWQGYLSRPPTLTFQNTTHQIIYFILHFIIILFPYQFFIIISNHHSLTWPKTTALNLNNF